MNIGEIDDLFFSKYSFQTPYGGYECLSHAILFWMHINEMDYSSFYSYNWNIHFNPQLHQIGGSITVSGMFQYLLKNQSIECTVCDFQNIPFESYFITAIDAYHLKYISEAYETYNQLHFVLAIRKTNKIFLFDPYFKKKIIVTESEFEKLWAHYKRDCILFKKQKEKSINKLIKPFVLDIDYKKRYLQVYDDFIKCVFLLKESEQELSVSPVFNKYFSSLGTIAKNRRIYFSNNLKATQKEQIIIHWNKVLKSFAQLTYSNRLDHFKQMLNKTFILEIEYLDSLIE